MKSILTPLSAAEYEKFLTRRSLGYRLKRLSAMLSRRLNERLALFDLTRSHWVVLSCLWHEQGVPVSEIANKVQQIGGTLTGVLDRMEKRKLLKRRRDRKDRRVWRVWLTAEGERLVDTLPPVVAEVWQQAFRQVSVQDRQRLSAVLNLALRNCCPEYEPEPKAKVNALATEELASLLPPYSLGYRIKLLSMVIGRIFTERASNYKVTPSHWIVLCRLWQQDGAAVSEIGQYLEQVGGTLAGVLERMEERGLIKRTQDALDRRCVRIWLTPAGRDLFAVLPPIASGVLDTMCAGMSVDDVSFLETLVDKMIANLEQAR